MDLEPGRLKSGNMKVDLLFHGIYEKEIKPVSDHDKGRKASELSRQHSQLKEEEAKLGWLFIAGKMSEETYNQLRREWQEKLRHLDFGRAGTESEFSFG